MRLYIGNKCPMTINPPEFARYFALKLTYQTTFIGDIQKKVL